MCQWNNSQAVGEVARGHTILGPVGYGKNFGFFFYFISQKLLKDFKQESSMDVVKSGIRESS